MLRAPPDRAHLVVLGHGLRLLPSGWREVAETALAFVRRFTALGRLTG